MDMFGVSKKKYIFRSCVLAGAFLSANASFGLESSLSPISRVPSIISQQSGISTGLLGGGHNSWFGNFSNVTCLNSVGTESTGGAGWVEFGSRLDTEEVEERLETTVSVGVNYGGFSLDGKGRYLNETKSNNLSLVTHFIFEYSIKNDRFIADPSDPLSNAGKAALNNEIWNEVCGDQFISNRTLGGKLAVALKYNFTSEFFRKEFEAELKGSYGIAEVNASMSKLSELTKQNTTLSIVAYQEGGRSYKLANILGNQIDNSGVFAADSCNLSDVTQCEKLISSVVGYAQSTLREDIEARPKPMKYALSPYITAGVNAPIQGPLPENVAIARNALQVILDSQVSQLNELSHIYKFYDPRLSAERLSQLKVDIENLSDNVESIIYAAQTCYSLDGFGDGSRCVKEATNATSNLKSTESTSFDVPALIVLEDYKRIHEGWTSKTSCNAPENHVVTGFGGAITGHKHVKTLQLQVRPILQNGKLGIAHIVKCGDTPDNRPEKFVTLPSGYVMVGFAGHVKHTNFVGLTAYAREYDPKTMRLIGPVESYVQGSSAFEMKYVPSDNDNRVITGMGLRVYKNNIRGYDLHTRKIALEQ